MADVVKLKSFEAALSTNNTVSNTLTTVNFGRLARLYNSNTTTAFVVTVSSANTANLNQSTAYANITMPPSTTLFIAKAPTDFVNGNVAILATSVSFLGG